jgi:hypothetical protein
MRVGCLELGLSGVVLNSGTMALREEVLEKWSVDGPCAVKDSSTVESGAQGLAGVERTCWAAEGPDTVHNIHTQAAPAQLA